LNARSILVRSLIFGFALTAAAQVWIELSLGPGPPGFLPRVAFAILAPGQFVMSAATLGMLTEDDLWLTLVLDVFIWAALLLAILLIIRRLRHDRPISHAG
jgi:apolipoprotein N-acyltransferase